ncbi:PIN domain-containing protein [Streptomyces sp. WAC04114]|uniref:PIN domain-containing protein n=1 Tax=Streptomyces sp. WAC04114 TaxID=2867961 RepID=UPI001C8B21FD|nr:PIN domain-containing protein [Streptomyces sp. WAC04114]MBX9365662.1 PIN domain-containing protein [Streptomyces sp. WAC04114]
MIILDTNILWNQTPEGGSSDLLRAIRAFAGERVAIPWMVMEELAAQQAIKYQNQYKRAADAVQALREATPWSLDLPLGPSQPDEVRQSWRQRWATVVDVIPTSAEALREAVFREANGLRPCKPETKLKTGGRDVAIWLSAVEYARANPAETVYFVSGNTKDFGDSATFPAPMDADVAGLTDRFELMLSLDDVMAKFAPETTTDEAAVRALLTEDRVIRQLVNEATTQGWLPMDGTFACTTHGFDGQPVIAPADGWVTAGPSEVVEVESLRSYRIGEREWCLGVVQYRLTGLALMGARADWASCLLRASVSLTLNDAEPQLTVLRADRPEPVSDEMFRRLALPQYRMTGTEEAMMREIRHNIASSAVPNLHPLRGPRAYEGALARKNGDGIGRPRPPFAE